MSASSEMNDMTVALSPVTAIFMALFARKASGRNQPSQERRNGEKWPFPVILEDASEREE